MACFLVPLNQRKFNFISDDLRINRIKECNKMKKYEFERILNHVIIMLKNEYVNKKE